MLDAYLYQACLNELVLKVYHENKTTDGVADARSRQSCDA